MNDKDLLQTKGYKPLAKLLEKWSRLSENLRLQPQKTPILLPDVFLRAHRGVSVGQVLSMLTDYFAGTKNLMHFSGGVPCVEFYLNKTDPVQKFDEISRLTEEIRIAAGFRNHFEGIVHVDVSEWLGRQEEKHFREFLSYLSENSDNWLIVLSIRYSDRKKEEADAMEAFVAMYLRLESVELRLPDAKYYAEVVRKGLEAYGLQTDDSAMELLCGSLKVIVRNRQFSGRRTVSALLRDIVYTLYSSPSPPSAVLTAADLADFSPESEYVRRTVVKMERRVLGFADKEDGE